MAQEEAELLVIFTDLNMQLEQEGEMVRANVRKKECGTNSVKILN